jgi:hypothetical protein
VKARSDVTIHWTFRDVHGSYPAPDFDAVTAPYRTTRHRDRARRWVSPQAARRDATRAGFVNVVVVPAVPLAPVVDLPR